MTSFIVFIALAVLSTSNLVSADGLSYCYWNAGANDRSGTGKFGVSDLPYNLCTHIVFSFVGTTNDGGVTILVEETEIDGKSSKLADFAKLRDLNPEIKLIISAGGWGEGSERFSAMVNNETARANFVANVVELLKTNGFQGFNMDWEYPAQRGGLASDKEAFVLLLRDLKAAFEADGFELSVAVSRSQEDIDTSFDVAGIVQYADNIQVMTYDFYIASSNVTGVNAPLYRQETDAIDDINNVKDVINLWLNNGVPASKLLLGVGTYAHTYTLASLDNVSTGAPVTGPGIPGPYTQGAGTWAYYEICEDQQANATLWNITEVVDNYVYANKDKFWAGYDNIDTAYAKGAFAKDLGLAGVVFWAADLDDFNGNCGNKYPIITAAINGYSL